MLSSFIEKIYKQTTLVRFDELDGNFYFSYTDFSGINMEPYSFKNKWGDDLSAYFYYPDNEIKGRIVIFEHGLGAGHRSYLREISTLVSHGYRVLAYDRTGCASSPGDAAKGLSSSLCDLDYCIRAISSDEKYKSSRISVVGHSWGGYSALNIAKLHPNVKHIVAISGFRSLDAMLEQRIPRPLKSYRRTLYALEEQINPEYVKATAEDVLATTDAKVLVIHSEDDPMVSCKIHFEPLAVQLSHKENIRFLKVNEKGHNPNYSLSASQYLREYIKSSKRNAKKLKTPEQRRKFSAGFDFYKMTEQDGDVWNEIFRLLDD